MPERFFNFIPVILFKDVDLDVVILKLKRHEFLSINFPPAMQCFGLINFDEEIHLIGHPGGNQMKEDSDVHPMKRNNETHEYIINLEQWSMALIGQNFYSGLHDKHKVLLHTTFDRGSSGSPGFHIIEREAIVVLMLSGGFPTCFYDGSWTKMPYDNVVEYGVSMADIYDKLKKSNEILCMEVFNLNSL